MVALGPFDLMVGSTLFTDSEPSDLEAEEAAIELLCADDEPVALVVWHDEAPPEVDADADGGEEEAEFALFD